MADLKKAGQYMLAVTENNEPVLVRADSNGNLSVNTSSGGSVSTQQTATIQNGTSLSNAIDMEALTLVGIHMSALWTTANLTFQVSEDGVTYDNLYDRFGNEIVYSVTQARFITIPPSEWFGIRFVKIRSGTSSVPVNQGALRSIVLVTKAV